MLQHSAENCLGMLLVIALRQLQMLCISFNKVPQLVKIMISWSWSVLGEPHALSLGCLCILQSIVSFRHLLLLVLFLGFQTGC